VFLEGLVLFKKELLLYYGTADSKIAVARPSAEPLLHRLREGAAAGKEKGKEQKEAEGGSEGVHGVGTARSAVDTAEERDQQVRATQLQEEAVGGVVGRRSRSSSARAAAAAAAPETSPQQESETLRREPSPAPTRPWGLYIAVGSMLGGTTFTCCLLVWAYLVFESDKRDRKQKFRNRREKISRLINAANPFSEPQQMDRDHEL
jgi:hypothetical protein